jgi:hypothetical protein
VRATRTFRTDHRGCLGASRATPALSQRGRSPIPIALLAARGQGDLSTFHGAAPWRFSEDLVRELEGEGLRGHWNADAQPDRTFHAQALDRSRCSRPPDLQPDSGPAKSASCAHTPSLSFSKPLEEQLLVRMLELRLRPKANQELQEYFSSFVLCRTARGLRKRSRIWYHGLKNPCEGK